MSVGRDGTASSRLARMAASALVRISGARLDLHAGVVQAGSKLGYAVVNRGRRPLLAGVGYGFEKRTALGWRPQHVDVGFPAVGLPLAPGGRTRELSADVPADFRPGRYRLTTGVTLMRSDGPPMRNRDQRPVNVRISHTFTVAHTSM